jgi:hypothetical protein
MNKPARPKAEAPAPETAVEIDQQTVEMMEKAVRKLAGLNLARALQAVDEARQDMTPKEIEADRRALIDFIDTSATERSED